MNIHPIRTLDAVIAEYRDYLRSEFRARDPELRAALEAELDRPLFLAQEPFYQAHRPFRVGARWTELGLSPALANAMVQRSRSETAYLHQSEAVRHLLGPQASPLVVTTGTGSGKSECFLLPVIQNAIQDARQFPQRSGVTAIIIYPMNALANDQQRRIQELLEAAGVAEQVDVRKYDRGTRQEEREAMRANPPRILLTNYMMLEYLLVRPADRDAIFANHRCRFVVLDEVHTYRGVLGSNIALLIRRLHAHLGNARQDWNASLAGDAARLRFPRVLNVATSATIKSISDPGLTESERQRLRDAAVQEFFHRLTGSLPGEIRVLGEVLEDIQIPAHASVSAQVPLAGEVDPSNPQSVATALCASAGAFATDALGEAAASCHLLWRLNQWLVRAPLSVSALVARVQAEIPERQNATPEAIRSEIDSLLVAGAALPEEIPGGLRLRAHRMIRGGWRFVRCVDPACGRIYPMGEPMCACGRKTAPLFLCRSCGADYLRLEGDPDAGLMEPHQENEDSEEWMLYNPGRHEESVTGDDEGEEGGGGETPPPRRRTAEPRVPVVRDEPVRSGSFDPQSMTFTSPGDGTGMPVRLVKGRSRCLCCGGTAGSRDVITRVALGTSAAVKVLGEGLVEALQEANRDKPGHDGKERLLIFSDSRQDAAHQARFISFAGRFDRMRRRLVLILRQHGELNLQRAVELLGAEGVRNRDNPLAPTDPSFRLSQDELARVRAWEEAPLLDEIAVTPFFRGTLVNLGYLTVRYEGLSDCIREHGAELCGRLGIEARGLEHLCRCLLDEFRVRSMLSRPMMRYHPRHPSCPDYVASADWERKVAQPKGLPVGGNPEMPIPARDNMQAPAGVTVQNLWRREGGRGRAPNFQRLMENLFAQSGRDKPTLDDASELLAFLYRQRFLVISEVYGYRDSDRAAQLNHEVVRLAITPAEERFRCRVCSKPLSGSWSGAPCPSCHGTAVAWTDEVVLGHRTIRRLLGDRYLPLVAQEHTAQITTERRVELEEQFKAGATEYPLNVLACSPTMEMGIDVGGLDAVLMRNIPPRPDNYAQRGGRAGRRTRVGLVVGYARNTPHDQYFFDHPEEMISGEIPTPAISLGNRDVILRHLCAIAVGSAEPGLAGRMVEYVNSQAQIQTDKVQALIQAVQARRDHALQLARDAWGAEILAACGLNEEALRRHLDELPAQIQRVMEVTARQVLELRRALDAYAASVIGRQPGNRAADLIARLLGIPTGRRGESGAQADDGSAGYPLRRFAEFGILPGYEFPSEPASLRLSGDACEESPVSVARRFGIYQFMPDAPVFARGKRWKVAGLDMSSPWNPREDVPWEYRICSRCKLHYGQSHPRCPRCALESANKAYPGYEFGGFIAFRNEAPILDEEDRIAARNLVEFYPQWDGEVFERWSVGPGWELALRRNEEMRWMNEGVGPTDAERDQGGLLHDHAMGFNLCPTCGRMLNAAPPESPRGGRRQRQPAGRGVDIFGHAQGCARAGQAPVASAIVAPVRAEVLRLLVIVPENIEESALMEWAHSLGAALRTGMRQHFVLDGSEIEFEPEGPWQEEADSGSFRRMSLTFVDPSIGGSGYIPRIAREFHQVAARALRHLDHPNCETACYRCLKAYQNQRHHDKLRWPVIMADLEGLANVVPQPLPLRRGDADDPRPWLEAYAAGVGSPLELRFLRLFEEHGFHPQRQVPVSVAADALPISIADFAVPERRLAIYIDGAAFHVGARLRRDRVIREGLRAATPPWRVVELRAHDLARGRSMVVELLSSDGG